MVVLMTQTNSSNHPGQTTWRQISITTKMACGARQPMLVGDSAIKFKVGGRMRWVEIELDASDTYTARLVRITRNYERIVVEECSHVYADSLSAVVYSLCNN